ncbi:MAG TPA: hypothetical protein VEH27_02445 [Methylomirabilota bacterium]|nr:hypothetical protein [Methylomirabilota bacterium]
MSKQYELKWATGGEHLTRQDHQEFYFLRSRSTVFIWQEHYERPAHAWAAVQDARRIFKLPVRAFTAGLPYIHLAALPGDDVNSFAEPSSGQAQLGFPLDFPAEI